MPSLREPIIPPRSVPWLTALGAIAALCIAWLAEFGFGMAPCELCYWQRYGYWAAILIAVPACFAGRETRVRAGLLWLLATAFLGVAAISLFHSGVEYRWWQGFTSCTGGLGEAETAEDVLAAIQSAPIVRCDEPAFQLFGISMAGYNFFYSLGLSAFAAWGAYRSRT